MDNNHTKYLRQEQCPRCYMIFKVFDEQVRFQINTWDIKHEENIGFLLRSFMERAEDLFMNPLLIKYNYKMINNTNYLLFREGIFSCPNCDNVIVKDQNSKEHKQKLLEVFKELQQWSK